ncbi:MAG: transporter, partial [Caulobacteraceae bacterium]|nr:transporter [Caulobacteraceae bacterium]
TLKPEDRRPIQVSKLAAMFVTVLGDRASLGYGLGVTAIYAALFGFLNSAQQVFDKVFHHAALFPAVFALASAGIAAASFTNARLVRRLGTRRISHTAVIGFVAVTSLDAALALTGHQSMLVFSLLQVVMMFCFGLIAGNFSAMAMENMGHMAGSASSVQGFMAMVGGAGIGFIVGQAFNNTVIPLTLGYCASGLFCLAVTLWAEKGRLFRAHQSAGPIEIELI